MAQKTVSAQKLKDLLKNGRAIIYLDRTKVYDVTEFVEDHPGGPELITDHIGEDITFLLADPLSHTHSESAYEVLDEFFLGVLDDPTASDDSETLLQQTTDYSEDYKKNKFLDLNKPLLMQVLRARWTKEFYLEQVHKPRHYGKGSAPIFGNFLEPISCTPWWMIPLIHIPVNMCFLYSGAKALNPFLTLFLYAAGLFLWTLVEYILHRFLFHLDYYLPENQYAFTLHFLLHGIHHFLPMDRLRLVMPPALMVVLTFPLYNLCHYVFRNFYVSQVVFAGAYMGYVMYDCTHYFLHHKQLPRLMKPTKVHHLDHHYKNFERGFGVTSKFWDLVFGTDFVDTSNM